MSSSIQSCAAFLRRWQMNQPAEVRQIEGPSSRLPVQSESFAMISMVERLARDPSIPMEGSQGLMDLARDLRREQAEEQSNESMSQAQQEMTPVALDSFN